jgi:hypothetical protein
VSWNATAPLAECTVWAERDSKCGADAFNDRTSTANGDARVRYELTAWNATAQDGEVAAGHAFAREACISCHIVEPENESPRIVSIGPSFQEIENTKGMTATVLRVS